MIDYVQRVWSPRASRSIDVIIDIMRPQDAKYWHQEIQPRIRALPNRADRNWRWPLFRAGFPIVQGLAGRRSLALTVSVANRAGRGIPAGMLALIENYPWLDPAGELPNGDRDDDSTFTWFLTKAPDERLRELGVPEPPPLGAVLLDTALVVSVNAGHKGKMWLHAAPAGGEHLMTFYSKRGLFRLNSGFRLPKTLWRQFGNSSDGRHFYATPEIAKSLLSALNGDR